MSTTCVHVPCRHCGKAVVIVIGCDRMTIYGQNCECGQSGDDLQWLKEQAQHRADEQWVLWTLGSLEREWIVRDRNRGATS